MNASLEDIYGTHHAKRRGEGFVLAGESRGAFLSSAVGTGKRVLDIGCRDGALTTFFAPGNQVLGMDIDRQALERAHTLLGIDTEQADLNGPWPFPDDSFDAIVAAEVLEHLYYPEVVMRKAARALTPAGVFAGSVPNAFSLINRLRYLVKRKKGTPMEDPTHINHFTERELRTSLAEAGFEDIRIVGYGRLGALARYLPQTFAFGLLFSARNAGS